MMEKIINRDNVVVAQIVRRRLDVFISYEKARTQNVWKNKSTKNVLVEIDTNAFLTWARKIDKWFADTGALVKQHNRPNKVWVYEDDINLPKAEVAGKIQSFMADNGLALNLTPETEKNGSRVRIARSARSRKSQTVCRVLKRECHCCFPKGLVKAD